MYQHPKVKWPLAKWAHLNTGFSITGISDFLSWKEKEECDTYSWYVLQCAPQEFNGKQHLHYYCNRAGKYIQQGKGERNMKSQGTCKTISHCSAHIKAVQDVKTNHITVRYTSTHYNHKPQLGHLRIPTKTRNVIASKLKKGIIVQRIINDIRDSTQTAKISREHLISRKT